jgi:methylated-DNA-[protein]-cysteine S-methyltransferase
MVEPAELYYSVIKTGWGLVAAVWSEIGLWELGFPRSGETAAFADVRAKTMTLLAEGQAACFWSQQLADELRLYFQGFPVSFGVPVDWRFYSPFQTDVLKFTASIPYGTTVSYQAVAQAVGRPKAARAVGGAMHSNRTPLVVPCHRVVGANGSLTGFGGGMEMKKALLLLESGGC